jgi:hypothetical protein
MSSYPLLDVFLTMFWFFMLTLWIFLVVRIIGEYRYTAPGKAIDDDLSQLSDLRNRGVILARRCA